MAIILIRGLDVLMIMNTLGIRGMGEFIHRSVQTWSLTLVFLASLVLVFIEIYCAFSLVKAVAGRAGCTWRHNYCEWVSVGGVVRLRVSGVLASRENRSVISCIPWSCKNSPIFNSVLLLFPLPAVGSSGCNNVYNRRPG